MATDIFKFKQFDVDQTGCAMKVNTDGVLLGALAEADEPKRILDIGTGTGVIALMLAQRFKKAMVDAVVIDKAASGTAEQNYKASTFASRLKIIHSDFATNTLSAKYDLIVSNPPFFLDSLTSSNEKKNLARHTDKLFFERLANYAAEHLTDDGSCQVIVPLATSALIKALLPKHKLYLQYIISVRSFTDSEPHREILKFTKEQNDLIEEDFIIYHAPKAYSNDYQVALREFLTIF
jgi:tRNA1Val (adenine37-N6)-methyltransferase